MQAKDFMTTAVISVAPDTSVGEIAHLLLEKQISAVPVIDTDGRLRGIVSEGDLVRRADSEGGRHRSWWLSLLTSGKDEAAAYRKVHGHSAADVMTTDVVSINENTPADAIVRLLEQHKIKRVPVVRDGAVVGIVSRANLLAAMVAEDEHAVDPGAISDQEVHKQADAMILQQGWLTHGNYNLIVEGGVVQLWGWVESDDERQALLIAVSEVAGVKQVNDHLGTVPPWVRGA